MSPSQEVLFVCHEGVLLWKIVALRVDVLLSSQIPNSLVGYFVSTGSSINRRLSNEFEKASKFVGQITSVDGQNQDGQNQDGRLETISQSHYFTCNNSDNNAILSVSELVVAASVHTIDPNSHFGILLANRSMGATTSQEHGGTSIDLYGSDPNLRQRI
eukprot:scaffold3238_cov91-Cylindrotheca_fusiformis.AAC.4